MVQGLLPVLEVTATAVKSATGFAAPKEAVAILWSPIILAQGFALLAAYAGFGFWHRHGSIRRGDSKKEAVFWVSTVVRGQNSGPQKPPRQADIHLGKGLLVALLLGSGLSVME